MIVENGEQIKAKLKDKYVTLKNAAAKLNVDYKYLTQTLNGFEGYKSVVSTLNRKGYTTIIRRPVTGKGRVA